MKFKTSKMDRMPLATCASQFVGLSRFHVPVVCLFIVLTCSQPSHAEACKNGVCVNGVTRNGKVHVSYRTTSATIQKVYVKSGGARFVMGPSGEFFLDDTSNGIVKYEVKACAAALTNSKTLMCYPTTRFKHSTGHID